jgi:hypothetical protein
MKISSPKEANRQISSTVWSAPAMRRRSPAIRGRANRRTPRRLARLEFCIGAAQPGASVCALYMPPVMSDRTAGGKTDTAPLHFVCAVGTSLEQAPRPFFRCHAYQQLCRLQIGNGHAASSVWITALARTQPAFIEARNPRLLLEQGETDFRLARAADYATYP